MNRICARRSRGGQQRGRIVALDVDSGAFEVAEEHPDCLPALAGALSGRPDLVRTRRTSGSPSIRPASLRTSCGHDDGHRQRLDLEAILRLLVRDAAGHSHDAWMRPSILASNGFLTLPPACTRRDALALPWLCRQHGELADGSGFQSI